MQNSRVQFIVSETTDMHDKVAEAYEALIDGEREEAIKVLDAIADKARALKKDLLTQEN